MTRQISTTKTLALRVTLTVLLLLQVAPSQTAPHHVAQQQQLLYYNHVTPPQTRQSTNVVVVPGNAAGIQQFAAAGVPLPVGNQYLLVEPGANPVFYATQSQTGDFMRDGGSEGGTGGIFSWIAGFIPSTASLPSIPSNPLLPDSGTSETNTTDESPTDSKNQEKPIKLVEGRPEKQSASLEKFDEDAPSSKPSLSVLPAFVPAVPGQRFVVVGQPQFFGNYDALRNHAVQQGLSTNGAVSSFLLLKNQQAIPLASEVNGKFQEAGNSVAEIPGTSALEFQRYLSVSKQRQAQQDVPSAVSVPLGYQKVVYVARQPPEQNPVSSGEDSGSITIEALKATPHVRKEGEDGINEDTENVEANHPGPSVAQVKPQAIALAGPGGVAAAAPIGTALVGPGGLAVAAPSATAVAGPSGGAPPPPGAQAPAALSSPAAYKAYLLEQQAKGSYPAGSYHLAYQA